MSAKIKLETHEDFQKNIILLNKYIKINDINNLIRFLFINDKNIKFNNDEI
jgi:hypothetical protein